MIPPAPNRSKRPDLGPTLALTLLVLIILIFGAMFLLHARPSGTLDPIGTPATGWNHPFSTPGRDRPTPLESGLYVT